MALLLRKSHPQRPLCRLLLLQSAAGDGLTLVSDADHRRPGEARSGAGGGELRRPVRGPPLPLPRPTLSPLHRGLDRPRRQAPPLLPRPQSRPPHRQGPVPQLLNPSPRSFSTAASDASDSDSNSADEESSPNGPDPTQKGAGSADPKEVERVCGVIEELFASDRNMEAVLDEIGVELTPPLVIAVLERFRHAHRPAYRFFRWAAGRPGFAHDAKTSNKMLSVLGKTRQFETMVALLEEMGKGRLLSTEAFKTSIKAFAAAREMKKSLGIFQLMKRHNFKAGLDTFNCLIEALAKAKLGKEAQALFEKLRDQYPPDLRTYTVLLLGWCKLKNLAEAGRVWNEMLDEGLRPDVVAHNTMLEGLLRGQRRPEAVKMLELMKAKGPVPNARTYTVVIQDLCKGGKMDLAVERFEEMVAAGCAPDVATYTCLMVGFGNARRMDKVSALLREMSEKGCPPDGRAYNALIKLMTNRGMGDEAVRIYRRLVRNGFEPTIHTYNMMMKCYFHGGNYEMGCAVWEEMGRKGICPDVNSYTVFIGGHIRHGRPEEACGYIEEMIGKGMKAPQIDYNKFAADFSRAGKPDALYELAQKMSFSGKFEVSNVFQRWAERMKNRVKRRVPHQTGRPLF